MHNMGEIAKGKMDGGREPTRFFKWIDGLLCLLMIFPAGIFLNFHRTLNAGHVAAAELAAGYVDGSAAELAARPSLWPTGGEITSGFGWRVSPWEGGSEFHQGIDIANDLNTPVVAVADGVVVLSGWAGDYGNMVQIDHGNNVATLYGHNSSLLVTVGQAVKKGQVIAYLGSTGKSTGPHIHYEVRINGSAVDPIGFMVSY